MERLKFESGCHAAIILQLPGKGKGKRQKAKGKKKGKKTASSGILLLNFFLPRAAAPAVLWLLLAISYFSLNIALREGNTYLFD
jgi:hypothetical protein